MSYDEILRAAYATFAQGNLDGYLDYCTSDIQFIVPGQSSLSGAYDREKFKSQLIPDVMRLTGGTFQETVLDVFTSACGGVVYAHHQFSRDGKPFAYKTMHLYD